jgi:hypothetical protein
MPMKVDSSAQEPRFPLTVRGRGPDEARGCAVVEPGGVQVVAKTHD